MPSIHKRPSGTYKVAYRLDGQQGQITVADIASAREAVRLMDRYGVRDALSLIAAQSRTSGSVPTVAEACRAHVAALADVTVGTRRGYERMIVTGFDPYPIAELPVDMLSRDGVRAWHAALRADGRSTKTVRNHHALLSASIGTAVEAGHVGVNVARGVRVAQVEPVHDMIVLTVGEFGVLLSAFQDDPHRLVLLLGTTGLRWGEATALKVGDVDLDARVPLLRITRAWKKAGGSRRVLGPPKTEAGARTVALAPETAEQLRPIVEGRPADAWLFVNTQDGPLDHAHFFERVWKAAVRRLNDSGALTKRPTIHSLRHFHASQLVAAGVPLNVVQKRLGHESITTTVDRYSHLAPDYLDVAAAATSMSIAAALPAIEG